MRILVVDDSAVMREIIMRTLREAGHASDVFLEASNGRQALEVIAEHDPHVVLCDWNMPEMSGIETLRALRKQGSRLPFCFVSPEATDEMRQEARDSGAFAFLTKPFTPDDFSVALSALDD